MAGDIFVCKPIAGYRDVRGRTIFSVALMPHRIISINRRPLKTFQQDCRCFYHCV